MSAPQNRQPEPLPEGVTESTDEAGKTVYRNAEGEVISKKSVSLSLPPGPLHVR